jgi:hypothetical protein
MTDDDQQLPPWGTEEAFRAELDELFAGPSPVNRIHGAIELDGTARGAQRPSQASIEAARVDILAALWGLEL